MTQANAASAPAFAALGATPTSLAARWPARQHLTTGAIGLIVLLGGFGGWGAFANISGAVIASGRIEVDQNRQVIQHPDGGVVDQIIVKEGSFVHAGDLLIRLDADTLRSELAVVEGQLFEVIARRARHEAERDGAETLTFDPLLAESGDPTAEGLMSGQATLHAARRLSEEQQKEQLARRREQIASQITGITAQQASLTTQLALVSQELASQQSLLTRGLTEATRVLALQREDASLSGRAGELTASVAQAEGRMTEIDIEILRIESARREEALSALRDLQYTELELSERRRTLRSRLDRLDIRAPVSGVVYDMQVFAPRSVLRPADPVLFLVPQDRPLVIAVEVEPIHIDQIFVGQEVNLRFSAFDQRRTPELTGEVIQISADSFEDQRSSASFYRAEIALGEGQLDRLPADITLIPGMPVEAFIRTSDRSPIAYFIKPLSDYFTKAFREN
jgi:HlyD family type I secretion membrane fusion protein